MDNPNCISEDNRRLLERVHAYLCKFVAILIREDTLRITANAILEGESETIRNMVQHVRRQKRVRRKLKSSGFHSQRKRSIHQILMVILSGHSEIFHGGPKDGAGGSSYPGSHAASVSVKNCNAGREY